MGRILTFFDKGVNGIGQWCILIFSFLCLALYCFYSFKLCKKQNVSHFKNIAETFTSVIPGLFFALFAGILSLWFTDRWHSFVFVAGLLLSGFSLALGLDLLNISPTFNPNEIEKNSRTKKIAMTLVFTGTIIPYIACGVDFKILNYVMGSLGVFTEHATLTVNRSEFQKLQAIADAKGSRLYSCRLDDEITVISDVRIWWHGIGERTYIEINAYNSSSNEKDEHIDKNADNSKKSAGFRVELESAGVRKSESQVSTSCIELRKGVYFDSAKSDLTKDQWQLTEPIISEFFKAKKDGDNVIIIGYADPRPSIIESNSRLAHDRACSIYKHLSKAALIKKNKVFIDTRGDMEGMMPCNTSSDKDRERSCEERNRRVELRLVNSASTEITPPGTVLTDQTCK